MDQTLYCHPVSANSHPCSKTMSGDSQRRHPQQALVRIEILDEAREDLTQGLRFYETREPAL
jgi:hypothetical protein